MKTLAISANVRKSVGKSDSKALRNQGMVPCVLYGGEKQVCFYAETNAFRNLVYTPEVYFVELNIDNDKYKAIMQDIQFHPVTDKILHIDFLEIFDDKEVTISMCAVDKILKDSTGLSGEENKKPGSVKEATMKSVWLKWSIERKYKFGTVQLSDEEYRGFS